MATIRQRGSNWEAQIRRKGWPTLSRNFSTKADARAWATVIESEIERGVFIDRTEAEKNTLGDLIRRYLQEVSGQKKGAESERYRLTAMLRDPLAQVKVATLSGKLIAEWRDKRLKQVSGSTTNRDLNLISHVINVARKEWGIHIDNPVSMVRRPAENRGRNRRLGHGEEERLLAALETPPRDPRGRLTGPSNTWMRPLVIVAMETAMRRGELLSLHWRDVDLSDRFARLHDTKNGSARDVPLSTRAANTLAALPRHISGRVFPITADAVKKSFTRAVARACLDDFHFHDLRHEATSRIADKLDNVLELSAVTGHKSLSMLKRYYHPRARDLALKLG
ncbi:Integrase [Cupriavidus phytorum]|uniref:Integrase n=1 Tax=Cupriavidus taiwanensis TaxID=164546 RepID=A0A375C3T7_9BURK|nr:site-specific integrase [Cupriavidus taiwanensis]SOY62191.1 Integrase [Cupriavidus taiwanensis]